MRPGDAADGDHGADSLYYRVNGEGRYEIIPLQFGSGRYQFTLGIARTKGSNRYAASGRVCLKCSMKDETSCFLYPNQYVDYSADSPAVKKARDLCEGLSDPGEIADRICDYVGRNYIYDWSRAGAVRSGRLKDQLPDVNTAWTTGKGTCQDLSALTCVMLRSRGIPAKLAIGRADGGCHCWVVIIIDGKSRRFDPTAAARSYQAERYY